MLRIFLAVTLLALPSQGDPEWSWEKTDESTALLHKGSPVWKLQHGEKQPKPFFHPLRPVNGPVLTWDAPPDHAWHHGLWFCWKTINGFNYWEENRKGDKRFGITSWEKVKVDTRPDRSARIRMDLAYHPPEGDTVLTEKRDIEISAPAKDGGYHLDWTLTFTAGEKEVILDRTPLPGEKGGKPWGGYAGLSVRMAGDLEKRTITDDEGPITVEKDFKKRKPGKAMDFSGEIKGTEAGIAMIDHPGNPRHPTTWYAIENPRPRFYWFNPAFLSPAPYTIPAGKALTLRYRVIVHPGRWNAETLNRALKQADLK